jgi:hypothetical protein
MLLGNWRIYLFLKAKCLRCRKKVAMLAKGGEEKRFQASGIMLEAILMMSCAENFPIKVITVPFSSQDSWLQGVLLSQIAGTSIALLPFSEICLEVCPGRIFMSGSNR